jgi:hypothetical protein
VLLANHLTQLARAQALGQGRMRGVGREVGGFHGHTRDIKGE